MYCYLYDVRYVTNLHFMVSNLFSTEQIPHNTFQSIQRFFFRQITLFCQHSINIKRCVTKIQYLDDLWSQCTQIWTCVGLILVLTNNYLNVLSICLSRNFSKHPSIISLTASTSESFLSTPNHNQHK